MPMQTCLCSHVCTAHDIIRHSIYPHTARHGIYPHTDAQAEAAAAAIGREQERKNKIPGAAGMRKVVTEVVPASVFWPAEKYHQRYLQKGGQSAAKDAKEDVRCYG